MLTSKYRRAPHARQPDRWAPRLPCRGQAVSPLHGPPWPLGALAQQQGRMQTQLEGDWLPWERDAPFALCSLSDAR